MIRVGKLVEHREMFYTMGFLQRLHILCQGKRVAGNVYDRWELACHSYRVLI